MVLRKNALIPALLGLAISFGFGTAGGQEPPARPAAGDAAYGIILKRNVFQPLPKPAGPPAPPPKVTLPSIKPAPLDDLVALRGTCFLEGAPSRSIAVVEILQTRLAETCHEESPVTKDIRVLAIRDREIVCEYAGEEILLTERGARPVPLPDGTPVFPVRMEDVFPSLDRELPLEGLKASAVERDGSTGGYRITGVRPGSYLARLGITDGDIVLKVNATAITTPGAALLAYENVLKYAMRRVVVRLERDGKPRTIVLKLE